MGRFETRWLTAGKNLSALADLSGEWIDRVHARRPPRGILLDMDSSVSPTHGEQENSVWNGRYDGACYHPLFVFNQFGDLEAARFVPAISQRRWLARRSPASLGALSRQGLAHLFPRRRRVRQSGCLRVSRSRRGAIKWTRLSCRSFAADAVRLQLNALAYNLGNFLRTLATPEPIKDWSLTSLKEKLIKIGAKVVSHGRYVAFQMAEIAISRNIFADILRLIAELRPPPVASTA